MCSEPKGKQFCDHSENVVFKKAKWQQIWTEVKYFITQGHVVNFGNDDIFFSTPSDD